MFRLILAGTFVALALTARADSRLIDFTQTPLNTSPTNFSSTVTGTGKPGDWIVIDDEVPLTLAPLSPKPSVVNKRKVVAQTTKDTADEHFPLLIFNGDTYGDFTATTRFKLVSGEKEQMAGIAFRIQDEKNYYVVRASALGNSFRFYKFINGQRSAPIGPEVKIPAGVWHEMSVTCKGNEIRCSLNGKELIPAMIDHTFTAGKIGLWTKSDSVSHFSEIRMDYTPREPYAQKAIREVMEKYPKLLGIKLYGYDKNHQIRLMASSDQKEIGKPGTETEENVIKNESVYTTKERLQVTVILPVRDRNGDVMAAMHVILKTFPGQTENNAVARALPVNQQISGRLQSAKDLFE